MNTAFRRASVVLLMAATCWVLSLPGTDATRGGDVFPTNEWINIYSSTTTANGQPVAVGAVIAVFDPQGVECGSFVVHTAGKFGLLPCYRDDPTTPAVDEGALPGDVLSFTIDGETAISYARSLNDVTLSSSTVLSWTQSLDRWQVDLNAPPQLAYAAPDAAACGSNQPCYMGTTALQDALDAVTDGGVVRVLGNHTVGSTLFSGMNGANDVVLVDGSGIEWTGGAGSLVSIGPGSVTVKGLTLTCQVDCVHASAFGQVGGTLVAYANNITGFDGGYSGSGSADLRHNWWGSGATAGSVGQDDGFANRLGAPVATWSEGGALADSGSGRDATIAAASGAGTAVIVSHSRGVDRVPFGKISDDATPCSDYYDFFVLNGSAGSTWEVTLPVDNTAGCNTYTAGGTAGTNKLLFFALTAEGAPDTTCTPDTACWNLYGSINRNGSAAPFSLTAAGVSLHLLGSTPAVAGDESGHDPTVITLQRLEAGRTSGWRWALALSLTMLVVLGFATYLGWSHKRRQAEEADVRATQTCDRVRHGAGTETASLPLNTRRHRRRHTRDSAHQA